ncbi:MAG: dicarboxylate/amino acid:cation symporter [Planctomycetaceae bacterium]|nr:MAG: dicarboxylate/amino acid:cation symporter [Planctomycetaceae bacterium]
MSRSIWALWKWPLHWQIFLAMLAGAFVGLALNFLTGARDIRVTEGLPQGWQAVEIRERVGSTRLRILRDDGGETELRVEAGETRDGTFATLSALRAIHPDVASVLDVHGGTWATTIGNACRQLGNLFLRMLQMVSVPLVVTSLITGVMGLSGHAVGRMFALTAAYYATTSLLAILTGLLVVNLFRPGLGGQGAPTGEGTRSVIASEPPPIGEVLFSQLENLIPANPLGALVEPNFLSIIAFSIAFAVFAMRIGGATARRVHEAAKTGMEVIMAMTHAIIRLIPLGVFCLMLYVTATQGADVFRSLGWYMLTVTAGLVIHGCITLPLILRFVAKRSPTEYARALSPALLTAFSSASSNGTLPLTLTCVEQRAGISNRTGSFVLPLGATINMDGTALYEAVAVLFIAQWHFGENLPLTQQIVVAVTALLASIGAAGIPQAGLVMLVIVLQAVNLPLELQGIILAVDRVLDMGRTTVNVWSDACGCAVIETLEHRVTLRDIPPDAWE